MRKRRGNFLEHFAPGQVFRHKVGKTVTEGLFNAFTEFGFSASPLAKNARYAERYGFAGLVAPAGLVMNVVFSQTVADISEHARANLEYTDMQFGAPVYIGDTLEATTRIIGVRPSRSKPDRGIVHVHTTGINQRGEVVIAFARKVQVWKRDAASVVTAGAMDEAAEAAREPVLPAYDPSRDYRALTYLTHDDTYYEDFKAGQIIEHSRGRTVTHAHQELTAMLDNASQVHTNQHVIDRDPDRYVGGQRIVYGGIVFQLCLGLSCPDIADNALAEVCYPHGVHTAPVFAGDTITCDSEIVATEPCPRPDLGVVTSVLRGYKYARDGDAFERVEVFRLRRQVAVKRRSHYA